MEGGRRYKPPIAFYSAGMGEGDTGFNKGFGKGAGCMGVKSDRLERPRAYIARKGWGGK